MSTECKKFIGYSSVFVFVCCLIVGGIEWRLRQNIHLHTAKHYQALFHTPHDVLILGSSRALHGIQPEILKTIPHAQYDFSQTMNFSLAGATSRYWLQWAKHILPHAKKQPSLVLLSVNRLSSARRIEQDSHFFPLKNWLKLAIKKDISQKVFLKNSLLSFAIHKRIAYVLKPEKTGWWEKIDEYDAGFVPIDLEMSASHISEPDDQHNVLNQGELEAIKSLIDIFQSQGIAVILLRTPSNLTIAPHEKDNTFTAQVRVLAEQKQVPFLNYNTTHTSAVNTKRDYFKDWMHLRRDGAEAFSILLKQDLQSLLQ